MKSWLGRYYSSADAEPVEASVLAVQEQLTIGYRADDGTMQMLRWDMPGITAAFDASEQSSRLTSSQAPGSRLLIEGKQAMEFVEQVKAEQAKPWYKKEKTKDWGRNLAIFLAIAGTLVTTYFLIVPWLSEKLAGTVSVSTEKQFGDAVYDALSIPAQQDKEATMLANEFFNEMKVETPYNIRVTVVKGDIVNAFALPGGHIVVYTALLKKLKSYPELAALLGHEFAHVNNRHSTKSVFRQLGSRVFIGMLFGKFGSVTSVLVDQADRFKSLTYSRGLEKEADMEGLAILQDRGIDPEGFVRLFQHLREASGVSVTPEFLASHPDIDKRINYIRTAPGTSTLQEHSGLQTIFEKIKQIK